MAYAGFIPNVVELASGKVAELVKSFEQVNEILDGFRYPGTSPARRYV